ncbi:hypothetical protein ACH5RR_016221 [Cinchona calisaya]|uniref:Uncharacterized protein n=1 Tax=Cinchona calisaya TaxID=153742 RepID=A0ABD2ZY19_9GENT
MPLLQMGSGVLQLSALLTCPPSSPPNLCSRKLVVSNIKNPTAQNTTNRCSSAIRAGGRVGGSEWEGTSTRTQNGRSRYHDEFDYDDPESGFSNTRRKRRIWWSDDSDEEDDDDEEEEFLDGLGILEGSTGFSSIFKVLRAFGWMVPAVVVSMVLGTGTNAFVMALALPLAQSALSVVFDMLWGRSTDRHRPKSRSQKRKRAYAGASSGSRTRQEKEQSSQKGKSFDDYQSWVAKKNVSAEKGERRPQNFGGWDELDKQGKMEEEPKTATANEKRGQAKGKLSRRARNRQTPLLVRLLIAFFPFLGFWTKFL